MGNIAGASQNSTSDIYYKIFNGQVAVPAELIDLELSERTSRGDHNQQKLNKPRTYTIEYQQSFVHRTIPEWNSLLSSVAQSDTVSTFKCRLSALPYSATTRR